MTDKRCDLTKSVIGRRLALADSDDNSTERDYELMPSVSDTEFCHECCCWNSCCIVKASKSRDAVTTADRRLSRISYRQQLEMKVLNERASEQVTSEQWKRLEHQMYRLEEATQVLVNLLDGLRLTSACMVRLSRLASQDAPTDDGLEAAERKIKEASDAVRDASAPPSELTVRYLNKASDMRKASDNFAHILRRHPTPSNKQLSKLEKQYDDIKNDYAEAKIKAFESTKDEIGRRTRSINDGLHKYLIPVLTWSSANEQRMVQFLTDVTVESIANKLDKSKSCTGKSPHNSRVNCCSGGDDRSRSTNETGRAPLDPDRD